MAKVTFSGSFGDLPWKLLEQIKDVASGMDPGRVIVSFVDDKTIRNLNRRYRKLDRATDVLSFEMGEDGILGDVVISVDTAGRNAKRFGTSLNEELKRLVVHGVLHLTGHDHLKPSDRTRMRKEEKKAMRRGSVKGKR